jgi:hypothetical protein
MTVRGFAPPSHFLVRPADAMVRASRSAQRQKIAHRRKEAQLAARNCPIGFVYQNWKLQGNAYSAEMSML